MSGAFCSVPAPHRYRSRAKRPHPRRCKLEVQELATALVGGIVPFVIELIKTRSKKDLSAKEALWLSLVIAAGGTAAAYFALDSTPTLHELVANTSVAFAISQVAYRHLIHKEDQG